MGSKMLINRKELLYYIFFILMIAAKGLGLDSGDRAYYILSALALAAVAGKLVMTRYSKKEVIVMGFMCFTAAFAYINSGRPGIVLSVLAIAGMKDMDVKKLFRAGLIVFGAAFAVKVSAAAAGVIPNALTVHEKGGIGEIIRWGMGFSTGNVFHESYFILTAFIVYNMGKKYGLKQMLLLMCGNLLVFAFSFSYTGILVTTFYLLLSLYAVKRKRLSKGERIIAQLPLPLCLLCSFITPFMVGTPAGDKLNSLLQARPAFSYYFLTNQPITLFGAKMKDVPNFWIIMDNGYVYFLMTFGIVAFAIFCAGYAITIGKYSGLLVKEDNKINYNKELAMIYAFLLYGIMEQFISNAFMNISIFFIGEVFFAGINLRKEKKTGDIKIQNSKIPDRLVKWGEKEAARGSCKQGINSLYKSCQVIMGRISEKRRFIYSAGMVMGILFLTAYLAGGKRVEYVTVPITGVNQIEAESVLLQFPVPYTEKDDLKREMKKYGALIEEEALLEKALSNAQAENISVEELKSIIQISIPQQVQKDKNYDAFRLRLLKSYYDVPQEVYRAVLEEIVTQLQENGSIDGKMTASAIYSEVIGKSFGTERMEHIGGKENYYVEKAGNIAAAENIRTGIIWTLTGLLSGGMLALAAVSRSSKSKRVKG